MSNFRTVFRKVSTKLVKKESVVRGGVVNLLDSKVNSGGAEEARTPDPLLAKQVLSQLSYSPL